MIRNGLQSRVSIRTRPSGLKPGTIQDVFVPLLGPSKSQRRRFQVEHARKNRSWADSSGPRSQGFQQIRTLHHPNRQHLKQGFDSIQLALSRAPPTVGTCSGWKCRSEVGVSVWCVSVK